MLKFTIAWLMYSIVSISAVHAEVKGVFKIAAKEAGIPAKLLSAVCKVESGYRNIITWDSGSASYGQCQVKLSTARDMGFKGGVSSLINPITNARVAARYLKFQLLRYNGDIKKAITAYNRGSYKKGVRKNNVYVTKVTLAMLE